MYCTGSKVIKFSLIKIRDDALTVVYGGFKGEYFPLGLVNLE